MQTIDVTLRMMFVRGSIFLIYPNRANLHLYETLRALIRVNNLPFEVR